MDTETEALDPQRYRDGRIAHIVDSQTVIINRGQSDGVRKGMKYTVVQRISDIRDPDNDEVLADHLSIPKAGIFVTQVFDRMSLCMSAAERVTIGFPLLWTRRDIADAEPRPRQVQVGDFVEYVESEEVDKPNSV